MKGEGTRRTDLRTLLVCPDCHLADQFLRAAKAGGGFAVAATLDEYPSRQSLSAHLGRVSPEVVALDVATGSEAGVQVLSIITSLWPLITVVALHQSKDADAIVTCVRCGAGEFLHLPFDPETLQTAAARIQTRQRAGECDRRESRSGTVVAFSCAKPGSGGSTLAAQTAFALRRDTDGSVLLADLDLMGGTLAGVHGAGTEHSILYLLRRPEQMGELATWQSVVANVHGVDLLAAPESPLLQNVSAGLLHELLVNARSFYDWVVLDLPSIFHSAAQLASAEADRLLLITTPELPSLHLTRRAVQLLNSGALADRRWSVALNRTGRFDAVRPDEMAELLAAPIEASLCNDYAAIHAAAERHEPVAQNSEIGRDITALVSKLAGNGHRTGGGRPRLRAAFHIPALSIPSRSQEASQ